MTQGSAAPTVGRSRRRYVLPVAVSVTLVIVATVYPLWAVVVMTVPIGALVAVSLAQGRWRPVFLRLALAILLLAIGGESANAITGSYGAVAAALPCVLAALLFALCSSMPVQEDLLVAGACVLATVTAGVAALLALVDSLDSLFSPLYNTPRAGQALMFSLLIVAAPGLILLLRLAVPWTNGLGARADVAAAIAALTGLASAFIFGQVPAPMPLPLITEVAANGAAIVLLVQATIAGARTATAIVNVP
jgi:hypothetical protein